MYLHVLEAVIAKAHPRIGRVAVSQAGCDRWTLLVTVHAPEADHGEIERALRRSEPSFRPRDYRLDYAFEG